MQRRARFGEYLDIDFDADSISCRRCGQRFCGAREDYKTAAAVEEAPVTRAGPVRGEDYDRGRIFLRLYYCPGCGTQLDVEVVSPGAPRPFFRLAAPA